MAEHQEQTKLYVPQFSRAASSTCKFMSMNPWALTAAEASADPPPELPPYRARPRSIGSHFHEAPCFTSTKNQTNSCCISCTLSKMTRVPLWRALTDWKVPPAQHNTVVNVAVSTAKKTRIRSARTSFGEGRGHHKSMVRPVFIQWSRGPAVLGRIPVGTPPSPA